MSESNSTAFLMKAASAASVGVAVILIVVKVFASAMTDSVALLSSLIDSSLDACASFLNFWAVRESLTPADSKHRFGHGKVEPLAAVAQAAFIAGSAVLLTFQSIRSLLRPRALENADVGMLAMGVSVVLTFALIVFQRYVIRKTKSVAIAADYAHYVGDILMNLSVMASLFIGAYWHFDYADPIFALTIAGYLLFSAWKIIKTALIQLTDAELPREEKQKIANVVLTTPEVDGLHDLRTRASGAKWFIQLHLELNPEFTLAKAHAVADTVEARLMNAFPNADVLIHQDPAGLNEKHPEWCYHNI